MDEGHDGGGRHYGAGGAVLSDRRDGNGGRTCDGWQMAPTPPAPDTDPGSPPSAVGQLDEIPPLAALSKPGDLVKSSDPVLSPPHYTRLNPQPMDVIRAWDLNWCRGSALKYIARAGHKGPEEIDLKKAIRCLQLELERLEG